MSTYSFWDTFSITGIGGINGANVYGWKASRFGSEPAYNDPPPSGSADVGPVLTGDTYGGDGAYTIALPTREAYYIQIIYNGNTWWRLANATQLADGAAVTEYNLTGTLGNTVVTGSGAQTYFSSGKFAFYMSSQLLGNSGVSNCAAMLMEASQEAYVDSTTGDPAGRTSGDYQVAINAVNWTANANAVEVINPAQGDGHYVHTYNNLNRLGNANTGTGINVAAGESNRNGTSGVNTTLAATLHSTDTSISTHAPLAANQHVFVGNGGDGLWVFTTAASTGTTSPYVASLAFEPGSTIATNSQVIQPPVTTTGILVQRSTMGPGLYIQDQTVAGQATTYTGLTFSGTSAPSTISGFSDVSQIFPGQLVQGANVPTQEGVTVETVNPGTNSITVTAALGTHSTQTITIGQPQPCIEVNQPSGQTGPAAVFATAGSESLGIYPLGRFNFTGDNTTASAPTASTTKYIECTINGVAYTIKAQSVA